MSSRTADAIVIGAGIIGATIAWRLRQQGFRVLVFDAGRMGAEASSAGAGMLAPGGEFDSESEQTRFALDSAALYPAYVEELQAAAGRRIDFQRHGGLELALTDDEWARLRDRAARQTAIGIASQPVDGPQIRQLAPMVAPSFTRGMYYPGDAAVDPRTVMAALRAVLEGSVRENTAVTRIDAAGAVTAGGETFSAGIVVLAAGAWATSIDGLPALPKAYPVRGHLISFEQFAGSLKPIVRRDHTYLLQRADGRTICGTSTEHVGFDRKIDGFQVSDIAIRARKLMPSLEALPVAEQWNGFRPAAEGGEPVVGRHEDTALWLAYGHYRNGILLAPETARRITCSVTASK